MNQTKITIYFISTAVVLALVAFIFAPTRITPDAFLEQGEEFFPEFTDPNSATSLEVITFDNATGTAIPFKVSFSSGRWTIPSHNDYPADGKERLAKTAAGIIDLKKDDFRTDNVSEHEICGVLDPLDETASIEGRGQRVTVKGKGGGALADIIFGNNIEGRQNLRFVRLPDQKRVYAARVDIDISTKFSDWIDTDLLKIMKGRIEKIVIKDYSINERTGSVSHRDILTLAKSDNQWTTNKIGSGNIIDTLKMKALLTALDSLSIVGVRKKPAGLSTQLKSIGKTSMSNADLRSLQSKGYYVSRDGQLLSNEGELEFKTADGVNYTLRFGEIVYASGMALTSGSGEGDDSSTKSAIAENRYLFITTAFDKNYFPRPKKHSDTSFVEVADSLLTSRQKEDKVLYTAYKIWEDDISRGEKRTLQMNDRFSEWYYVISSESYDKIHLNRGDLITKK